jgi:hypothetical protein
MTTLVEPVQQAADAAALMERWLDATNDALLAGDHAGVVAEVLPHGWWRDQLALSWDLRTAHGTEELTELLRNRLHAAGLRDLGVAPGKVPAFIDAGNGTEYLQAFITFHTAVGRGEGLVRLTPDEHGTWRAWTVLTALAGLDGHAERWAHGGPPEPSTAASGVPRSGPSVVSGRSRSRTASRRSSSSALCGARPKVPGKLCRPFRPAPGVSPCRMEPSCAPGRSPAARSLTVPCSSSTATPWPPRTSRSRYHPPP